LLIIFDLDDTLIDTSGSITPFKLRACLKLLGLEGPAFEQELFKLNQTSLRSKDALLEFCTRHDVPKTGQEAALKEMFSPLPDDFQIPTTPFAKETLSFFHKTHHLALVTGGAPPLQRQKIEKAGIEAKMFSKIAIPEDSVKKPVYLALLQEFSVDPKNAWVCGDRVTMDLIPARELGMRTVHMRWGRGNLQIEKWVESTIQNLSELKEIIR
jgi:FMN phosphatase YigB (HAD superfamily)